MLRRFAIFVLAFNVAVILWGAFVRASGSGAGCGAHWPTCNGEVVHRPESIETAIELTHRATSGIAMLLVFALGIAAFRARPKKHPMRGAALASVVLIVLEAAIGAGIVLLELVDENASIARAAWMGMHLANTFLLLGALVLNVLRADDAEPKRARQGGAIGFLVFSALALTIAVGVSGAMTALGDTLFPSRTLAEGIAQDFSPTAHFLVRLRVWHPVLAIGTCVYVLLAVGLTFVLRSESRVLRPPAIALASIFLAQIACGFLNLLLRAPTWMQIVHLLLADLVWIALVVFADRALRASADAEIKIAASPIEPSRAAAR